VLAQFHDLRHLRRCLVGCDGHDAAATDRHVRDGDRVVAAQYDEIIRRRRDELRHLHQVAGRLDADDVRDFGEPRRRLHV
jgi:hypothetical protein